MGGLRRSECPGGRVMLWLWGANPHITPPTPHVRVVGHTIDRCITRRAESMFGNGHHHQRLSPKVGPSLSPQSSP